MNNIIKKRKKGFTLIELIIVIAIIAILAAIAIPKFATIRHNANVTTDIANAKNIHSVVAQGIANEKIKLPTTTALYDVTSVGATSPVNIGSQLDAGGVKSKIMNDNFKVALDSNGNITVYATSESAENEVYPTAGGKFQKK